MTIVVELENDNRKIIIETPDKKLISSDEIEESINKFEEHTKNIIDKSKISIKLTQKEYTYIENAGFGEYLEAKMFSIQD